MVSHVETWRAASLQTQPKNRPMSDDRFQNKYRIESARADWHDYDGGSSFITICTKNREHFFGEIENGGMVLSDIGKYVTEQFGNVSMHYPYAEIPLFTIMPNHVHIIVVIDGNKTEYDRRMVETWRAASLQDIAKLQGWLSVVIGGLKSSITRFANEKQIDFSWQPRFHDHIIRDNVELNHVATYIENNVANWVDDEFYTP
jgi:REP element-mobilizing transposase RayT